MEARQPVQRGGGGLDQNEQHASRPKRRRNSSETQRGPAPDLAATMATYGSEAAASHPPSPRSLPRLSARLRHTSDSSSSHPSSTAPTRPALTRNATTPPAPEYSPAWNLTRLEGEDYFRHGFLPSSRRSQPSGSAVHAWTDPPTPRISSASRPSNPRAPTSGLWGEFQSTSNLQPTFLDPYSTEFTTDSRHRSGSFLSNRMRAPTYQRNQDWLAGSLPNHANGSQTRQPNLRRASAVETRVPSSDSTSTPNSISQYMLQHHRATTTGPITSQARTLYRPVRSESTVASNAQSRDTRLHVPLPRRSTQSLPRQTILEEDARSESFFPDPLSLGATLDGREGPWPDTFHLNLPPPRPMSHWLTRTRAIRRNSATSTTSAQVLPATSEREDDLDSNPLSEEDRSDLLELLLPDIGISNYMTDAQLVGMSYTDLLDLADSVGPAAASLATLSDLEESGLRCCAFNELSATGGTGEKCFICLEEYNKKDQCRILRCRHAFHQQCVDLWLTTGLNSCPMCRQVGCPRVTAQPHRQTGVEEEEMEYDRAI